LPQSPAERARARWLEEYADTRIEELVIRRLFNQVIIRPYVWGRETDQEVVQRATTREIPALLDYLEPQVPEEGWFFQQIGLADVAIAAPFRNAAFAGFKVDASRWPRAAAFLTRVLDHPAFLRQRQFEDLSLRTPIAQQRDELRKAGAPVSEFTYGTGKPREGVMQISP